jgi:hypothetical protein
MRERMQMIDALRAGHNAIQKPEARQHKLP